MELSIKRWGNGAGLPLSKMLRKHLHSDIGDNIDVQIVDDGLLIRRVEQQQFSLDDLLASCTSDNTRLDADDVAWLNAAQVGKEI